MLFPGKYIFFIFILSLYICFIFSRFVHTGLIVPFKDSSDAKKNRCKT